MKQKGNKKGFTGCAQAYIRKLQEEGRFSTAHVYKGGKTKRVNMWSV